MQDGSNGTNVTTQQNSGKRSSVSRHIADLMCGSRRAPIPTHRGPMAELGIGEPVDDDGALRASNHFWGWPGEDSRR
jgi:hypothetical protein